MTNVQMTNLVYQSAVSNNGFDVTYPSGLTFLSWWSFTILYI